MNTRAVTNADLWAAIRGNAMFGLSNAELIELRQRHVGNTEMFASRVIAEAARQVLELRKSGRGCP